MPGEIVCVHDVSVCARVYVRVRMKQEEPECVKHSMVTAAAYNSFVMYRTKIPEIIATKPKVQRRIHLEALEKDLCKAEIRDRVETWE